MRRPRRRTLVLLGALLVPPAGFAVRALSRDAATAGPPAAEVAETTSAVASRRFEPGMARRYRLSLGQHTVVRSPNDGDASPSSLGYDATLAGTWSIAVSDVEDGRVHLRAAMEPAAVDVASAGRSALDAATRAELQRALASAFFVTVGPNGSVEALHFPPSVTSVARGFLRSVVASTLVAGDARLPAWSATEADASGEYLVGYRRLGPDSFEKKRLEQLRVATPKGLVPAATAGQYSPGGAVTFRLDGAGWVVELRGRETLDAKPNGLAVRSSTQVDVEMELVSAERDESAVAAFSRARDALERTAMTDFDGAKEAREASDRALLAGASWPSLRADLLRVGNDPARARDRAALARRLAALFRHDPASVARTAEGDVRELEGPMAATVLGALAEAGTPEAQIALVKIANDAKATDGLRANAVTALGHVTEPTSSTMAALEASLDDASPKVRSRAALAYGAAVPHAAGPDAEEAVDELLRRYAQASSPDERALLLEALGNAADPRLLPIATRALAEDVPVVRAAAVSALRKIEEPEVDGLLERALSDAHDRVRMRAIAAIADRAQPERFLPALGALLGRDPSKQVRADALRRVAALRAFAQALDILRWSSEHDPDADLRKAAAELLAG